MITRAELNPDNEVLSGQMLVNFEMLYKASNIIRAAYGKPLRVTSGVRSPATHRRIYVEIARRNGVTNPRIPMGSKHLQAAAADFLDLNGDFYRWCKANPDVLAEANVYLEEDTSVPRVHIQVLPFGSYKPGGTRWFKP